MAVESSKIVRFDILNDGEERRESLTLHSASISDDKLIELIVSQIPPQRRLLAKNQIKIYFKKIASHPGMRLGYIKKIKQLVIYEKNSIKKPSRFRL